VLLPAWPTGFAVTGATGTGKTVTRDAAENFSRQGVPVSWPT
jgi:hypothetical protein